MKNNIEETKALILSKNNNHLPEVGMGGSIGGNGDLYPYTIHKVSKDLKVIWASSDRYQAIPKEGGYQYGDDIPYKYSNENQNDESQWTKYKLRKNGYYVQEGCSLNAQWQTLHIGYRCYKQNPSF